MNWLKEGNFNNRLGANMHTTNKVEYHWTGQPKLNLTIRLDKEGFLAVKLQGSYSDHQMFLKMQQVSKLLLIENILHKFLVAELEARVPYDERQKLIPFIEHIGQHFPIQSLKKEIFETIHVKAIVNETAFYESLAQLIDNNQIKEAMETAYAIETDDDVLFNFGRLLEDRQRFSLALDVYQSIPASNPNYSRANGRAAKIAQLEQDDHSFIEKRDFMEKRLRFMLREGNPDNQALLDRLFANLCEDKNSRPLIKDVKNDEETLISLAQEVSKLRLENEALKNQNALRFIRTPSFFKLPMDDFDYSGWAWSLDKRL